MEEGYSQKVIALGQRIKNLRKEKGFTQFELGVQCDVDIRTIQRIEAGEHNFGMHIFFAIAQILELPPEELVKGL